MEERQREACPVPLSLIFFKKYMEFHSIQVLVKYTSTYLNALKSETVREMVKLATSYFSHALHFKVSIIQSSQCNMHEPRYDLKNTLYQIGLRVKFIKALNKLSFIMLGKHKFNVFENSSRAADISPTDRGLPIAALDL
jgi:predicted proteasome-type protease